MKDFVHLHLHTHFSFLDATNKILHPTDPKSKESPLMDAVRAHGQRAVAVTEHGNLCSAIQFYNAARDKDLKPIIGCEVYVTPGSHRERKPTEGKRAHHLLVLASDLTGYHNLIKLVSAAHLDGMYYRPRVDHELLAKYNAGLIATSGCMSSEVSTAILAGDLKKAEALIEWHAATFDGRFYLEVQRNSIAEQETINRALFDFSARMNLPLVATNDCHYLRPEDAKPHDILLCVGTNKTIHETKRKKYQSEAFYLRSTEEMYDLFSDHPEAAANTAEIAERCNLDISMGGFIYPQFDTGGRAINEVFEEMTREGLDRRFEKLARKFSDPVEWTNARREYDDRLAGELALIEEKGFAGYLLIVQDFMNWARRNDVRVGPGRGSAAGSVACWALGITDIDPVRYSLLFERFLNPERADNPDIDCDFCAHGRDRVIEYVTKKYGEDNVCQIATFGTLKAKAAVRDVGRALGYPYGEVDKLAKLIPGDLNITLDDAVKKDSELRSFLDANAWAREIMEGARALEGSVRNPGKHAAGLVIAPQPLTELVPLMRDKDGYVMTQWDKNDVEKSGLIKFDFLGLKTLTIIDKALALIKSTRGVEIDIDEIAMDDAKTFDLLSQGLTTGVFQLESRGMKELLLRIAPRTIDEIVALVALYRPGPIGSGMIDTFIASKKGEQAVVYELPMLEEYLRETYGMMVYQEQVMQVANAVAGFSLGQSDLMRRAMSKKDKNKMVTFSEKFLKGAAEREVPAAKAEKIWDQMEKFAEYGFNKSHSAAYGVVAYQTAWLKANYPIEFMAELLTLDAGDTDKLHTMVNEVREMGLEILPPDINHSVLDFMVEDGRIRYGLAGIKGIGEGAIEAIVGARAKAGSFRSISHLMEHLDTQTVNRRVLESLVRAGAFDELEPNRARLFMGLDTVMERASREARDRASGQVSLFGSATPASAAPVESTLPEAPPWSDQEKLDHEKLAFGFFLTGHPLRQYAKIIRKYTTHTCESLREITASVAATVGVIVTERKFRDTPRGRMAILEVEDLTGSFEAIVYSEPCAKYESLIKSDEPLLMKGRAEAPEDRGPKIFVEEVTPLASAQRSLGDELHIRLASERMSEGAVDMLKRIVTNAKRGRCRPVLRVALPGVGDAVLRLPPHLGVEPSDELIADIEQLLGRDVVMFS
ncbi:MAG: DNA polymerase III subunit alpha [Deltaproteobacteria bacterium]|nr:DNA polymerase III subunit alpha [Deltaproteobacteria bacterium]